MELLFCFAYKDNHHTKPYISLGIIRPVGTVGHSLVEPQVGQNGEGREYPMVDCLRKYPF